MINIYGKGGHAKMIASLLTEPFYFYNDLDYTEAKEFPWIIAIGDNPSRQRVALNLINKNYININAATYLSASAYIGIGVVIAPGAVIQNNVFIGDHVIINTSASIDHDCKVGNFCHIAPNSTLCGDVDVGDNTLIGAGSVILPGIKIGKNCIVGAGSVVTKNIPSNSKAYGNPAKLI